MTFSAKIKKPPTSVPAPILLGWRKPDAPTAIGFQVAHNLTDASDSDTRELFLNEDGEGHLLTIGSTGSGKGRCAILPASLTYPGSIICVDPKGEAARVSARRRREMGQEVVLLDPFNLVTERSDTFNPFDLAALTDLSPAEFGLLTPSFLHPDSNSLQDPFWDKSADALIAGASCALLAGQSVKDRSLIALRRLLKADDVVYKLAVMLDKEPKPPSLAYENIGSFLNTEDKCRSGILATAQQHFSLLADPRVEAVLASTSFDLEGLMTGKEMSLYLILPPSRLASHSNLLRIWLVALLHVLKSRTFKVPTPTLALIDETAQLGRTREIVEIVTLLRSYSLRCWTFFQSIHQLRHVYGADAGTLLDNAIVLQVFGCSNYPGAEAIAALLGPGVSAQDLLELGGDEQIVCTQGRVQKLQKLDYLKDKKFQDYADKNTMYEARGSVGDPRVK